MSAGPAMRAALLSAMGPLLAGCTATVLLDGVDSDGVDKAGAVVDGEQQGLWEYYYPPTEDGARGALQARGRYEADRRVGRWTYWYANGRKEVEGAFVDHRRSGFWWHGYEEGGTRSQGVFVAGREDGPWCFYWPGGALRQVGVYDEGRPVLRWTDGGEDGEWSAEGFYLQSQRAGTWRFRDETGDVMSADLPVPEGHEAVAERWPSGAPARDGWLVHGRMQGPWVSWHENGLPRAFGRFDAGVPCGTWRVFDAAGVPLAEGRMDGGEPGAWHTLTADRGEPLDVGLLVPVPLGQRSPDDLPAEVGLAEAVRTRIAELVAAAHVAPLESAEARPAGGDLVLPARLEGPVRAQHWTVHDRRAMRLFDTVYRSGWPEDAAPSGYPSVQAAGPRLQRDHARSSALEGVPLPATRLTAADGQVLDLEALRGRGPLLVIVLRGFAGHVCVYCVVQTTALCSYEARLEELGAEVVLVYPGKRDALEAFVREFEDYDRTRVEPVPFTWAYDPDFEFADALGIGPRFDGDLAFPTTLVVDRSGVVRYAFVGPTREVRPPLDDVVRELEEWARP